MTDHQRPGYLARTQPIEKTGVLSTPASGQDVWSNEPETPSQPVLDPRCAPRPLSSIGVARMTAAGGVPQLLGSLEVPNGALYEHFELQWWVDYPLAVSLGLIQVFFRYNGGEQDVIVPQPLVYPARYCHQFERGDRIDIFAVTPVGFDVSDGPLGTPFYVGFSAQLGWERSQFPAAALAGTDLQTEGTKRASVVVLPGSALANPFATLSLVATRLRVFWPVRGAVVAGQIAVTTANALFVPQAASTNIEQGLGNTQATNSVELDVGDIRELAVGNPAPNTPLGAPATLTVEWDQWRVR